MLLLTPYMRPCSRQQRCHPAAVRDSYTGGTAHFTNSYPVSAARSAVASGSGHSVICRYVYNLTGFIISASPPWQSRLGNDVYYAPTTLRIVGVLLGSLL